MLLPNSFILLLFWFFIFFLSFNKTLLEFILCEIQFKALRQPDRVKKILFLFTVILLDFFVIVNYITRLKFWRLIFFPTPFFTLFLIWRSFAACKLSLGRIRKLIGLLVNSLFILMCVSMRIADLRLTRIFFNFNKIRIYQISLFLFFHMEFLCHCKLIRFDLIHHLGWEHLSSWLMLSGFSQMFFRRDSKKIILILRTLFFSRYLFFGLYWLLLLWITFIIFFTLLVLQIFLLFILVILHFLLNCLPSNFI